MRVLIVPLIAVGLLFGSASDEPTEHQMRTAFEASLAARVQSALDFVTESGDTAALERIRQNGTDRFNINGFQKRECVRDNEGAGYICVFDVKIGLINGALSGTMTGRFMTAPRGLIFDPQA